MTDLTLELAGPAETESLGADFACVSEPCVMYLTGELGAGKTTLARGFLRALGHEGRVKSPSFSVLECYAHEGHSVFHLDLFRLSDPGEVAYLGLDAFRPGVDWLLIEWPEHGRGWLPGADIALTLDFRQSHRLARVAAVTPRGSRGVSQIADKKPAKTNS